MPPPLACASGTCKSCNDNSGGGAGGNVGNGVGNHMMSSIANPLDVHLDSTGKHGANEESGNASVECFGFELAIPGLVMFCTVVQKAAVGHNR